MCHTGKIDIKICLIGDKSNQTPRFIIWGDSYADALTPAFTALGKSYKVTGTEMSLSAGGPLLNLNRSHLSDKWNHSWKLSNQSVLQFTQKHPEVTDVFLIGSWPAYALGAPHKSMASKKNFISYFDEHDSLKAFELSLKETVVNLTKQGKRIWVVLPIPEADRHVPRWLTLHENENKTVWIDGYPMRRTALLPIFKKIQAAYGIRLLDPSDILCRNNKQKCRINANGKALYVDEGHLSATGAVFISEILRPAFNLMQQENQ